MPNNFDLMTNEFFLDVTLNGKVLRYWLTGFDGSPNNDFETALNMVMNAYILRHPGFTIQSENRKSLNDAIIHFSDDKNNPGQLFFGAVTGHHVTSKTATLNKLKQQAREQLGLSPLSLSDINLETTNPVIDKKANIFVNIAPSGLAISNLVQHYQQQSHEADGSWYYTRMGTEGLSKQTLEKFLALDPEALKKKTYGERTSYNDRNGDSEHYIAQAKGRFGSTLHVKSGSTRGSEVYFTEGLFRNLDYSTFRSVIGHLMQPSLYMDAKDFSDNTEYQDEFRHALQTYANEYKDDVLNKMTSKDLSDLFAGLQNIHRLLPHLEERFGLKLAQIFYDSIDASDYGAFWAHDLHAINAAKLLLKDENVTQLGKVVFSTDLFKDCDDFLGFLMVNEEFLLDGTFGGIPCESMDFYAAADVRNQRLKGMQKALELLADELKKKYPEKIDVIQQRLMNIQVLHGFDAASDTELSHFTTPDQTIMPCNAQKQPAINLGGVSSFYLRQPFQRFCDDLGINLNEIDEATKSYYSILHSMWNLNVAEFNDAHPNVVESNLSADHFKLLQTKLRAHINGQYTKAEKTAGLALSHADACDVITTVFRRFAENDLEPILGFKGQSRAMVGSQSIESSQTTPSLLSVGFFCPRTQNNDNLSKLNENGTSNQLG